ncbi:hypothetical protein EXIGLDRAFT_837587 [Exidia glandulosa HHB12029]|uniref:Uncharacterized protein n=1 Tax=Exidia glandulosa HHB12029 TaxID=1314781 RepID=A0A166ACZ4_EXIGL|nr:hypothetical protein EXIGLDRAFT_837587 [Exidia glandulosa HHB12029]
MSGIRNRFTQEVVPISAERRNQSFDDQLAAGARVISLGDDVTQLVFSHLTLGECIVISHVCAYWRCLALADPFLWTELKGNAAIAQVLWARSGVMPVDATMMLTEDTITEVLTIIPQNLSRMVGLGVITRAAHSPPLMAWSEVLHILCQSAPLLERLHLERPDWWMRSPRPPIFPLRFRPSVHAPRLRTLAILNMVITNFSWLPSTLTSFAYGASGNGRILLTGPELHAILQCRSLENLWLSVVAGTISHAEIFAAGPASVSLKRLRLGPHWKGAALPLLDYIGHQSLQNIEFYDSLEFRPSSVLDSFQGHHMVIHPTTASRGDCNIVVSDSENRTRHIRATRLRLIAHYPSLWESLASLTLCGDTDALSDYWYPPVPRLGVLTLFYHRATAQRTLDPILLCKDDVPGGWDCPALHTLVFALASPSESGPDAQALKPINLPAKAVLRFVTDVLSSADVIRILVRGDGWRLTSEYGVLPSSFEIERMAEPIAAIEPDMVFRGF